jgi:pimeloyl-ACP methyl ester carboxylesterase
MVIFCTMPDQNQLDPENVEYLIRADSERIAVSRLDGCRPGVIFFGGLRSDMNGVKALHVEAICRCEGRACTRFDYSGHGRSGGQFEDGTISQWLADAATVVEAAGQGPHIFVGSSLGGWLALLLAIEKPETAAAIVGVSAAADFTAYVRDSLFSDTHRQELAREGRVLIPDCHGGPPFAITRTLIEDGERHLLLERKSLPIKCPIRLIHARKDRDVPWDTGLRLAEKVQSSDVQVKIIKDGEHQLARPSDLGILETTLISMFDSTSAPE